MKIDHGPPGVSGVKTLMSVGADGVESVLSPARLGPLDKAGIVVWLAGVVARDARVRRAGLALGLGAIGARLLSREK